MRFHGGRAVKRGPVFDDDGDIGQCAVEAMVVASLLQAGTVGVAEYHGVSIKGGDVMIEMENGAHGDLWTFVHKMEHRDRMRVAGRVLEQLTRALVELHAMGIAHNDMKPSNIVVTCDDPAAFEVKLVDFGASVFCRRTRRPVRECTYAFAAPEAFEDGGYDLALSDLYSLGATVWFVVTGGDLPLPRDVDVDDFHEVKAAHRSRLADVGSKRCPPGVPDALWSAVKRLLDYDPATRRDPHAVAPEPRLCTEEPPVCGFPGRDDAVGSVYQAFRRDGDMEPFALAVSVMDRYMAEVDRACRPEEVAACIEIAAALLTGRSVEHGVDTVASGEAVLRVLGRLRFRVYADTCDRVLIERHKKSEICYTRLAGCICAAQGSTEDAVARYLADWC